MKPKIYHRTTDKNDYETPDAFSGKYTFEKRLEVFWRATKKLSTGCILFIGARTKDGYGKVTFYYKTKRAHHVAFYLKYKRWPKNQLCHTCDVPLCVNVKHLFECTQKDNRVDCAKKGRTARGTKHPFNILTNSQVKKIRKSKFAINVLAKKYNVNSGTIYGIKHNLIWKWLD